MGVQYIYIENAYLTIEVINKRRIIADNFHVSYDNLTDGKTTQSKTRVKKRTAENYDLVRSLTKCKHRAWMQDVFISTE